ncbi:hypothetical protein [Aquimarina megaterium]|uniref:hypothetical protein n=1 Tax=Aquimarina megaterium TaxID=1443666 RepID=UPI0015863F76|nr:hypothetical protein [Aquimarina megaterium]
MSKTLELQLSFYAIAYISGTFFEEFILKTIMSTLSLLIATTAAYFWKKYLDKKHKK